MNSTIPIDFGKELLETMRDERHAEALKTSALDGRLMPWTRALTAVAFFAWWQLNVNTGQLNNSDRSPDLLDETRRKIAVFPPIDERPKGL